MMSKPISKLLRISYNKTVNSIAFYPGVIAIGFLLLSWLMLKLDFSETGMHIKSNYSWVRLKDANTARAIVSTIAGGIISLMVFSFSMVMILLNQAASQMSNRMLDGMIGNRFQQLVLGAYIGTIVYALFLLSIIRDIESGVYVPALSIYLLLIVTIGDIFLFIYFLHYVTQSVKFGTIISRVHKKTYASLKRACSEDNFETFDNLSSGSLVMAKASGYFQGFDRRALLSFATKKDIKVQLLHPKGTFVLKNQPVLRFQSKEELTIEEQDELILYLDFFNGESIDKCFFYGFHQLTEVALKALSPGINDPQTAVIALNALSDLLLYRLQCQLDVSIKDNEGILRVILTERSFVGLFTECINPIWHYGADDQFIQDTMLNMLVHLMDAAPKRDEYIILNKLSAKVEEKRKLVSA